MKIRMQEHVLGRGGVWEAGQEYDVPEALGKAWIANGQAEPVTQTAAARRDKPAGGRASRRETRG